MSNTVYPNNILGLSFGVVRSPEWNTGFQRALSGKQSTIAYQVYPFVHFELDYELLRDDISTSDLKALVGLLNSLQGRYDTFLFQDPDFNAVTAQSFGTGDGTTASFQLVATYGNAGGPSYNEIIQALNGSATVYVNGVQEYAAARTAPGLPTLSQVSGGTLAARTRYVKLTYLSANGETAASSENSFAISANNLLHVANPGAQTGCTQYNVYAGTAAGAEKFQATVNIGTGWTEPTGGITTTGAAPPVSNTTGWGVGTTGLVTFNGAPVNGAALTWTGGFYYRCRFDEDSFEWTKFLNQWWQSKVKFTSVIL